MKNGSVLWAQMFKTIFTALKEVTCSSWLANVGTCGQTLIAFLFFFPKQSKLLMASITFFRLTDQSDLFVAPI